MTDLTEETMSFLSLMEPLSFEATPLADLRKKADDVAKRFRGDVSYTGTKEDRIITEDKLSVPVTVLKPATTSCSNAMVYYHGGGWTWGSRRSHMSTCELISQLCNCVVVNVEYRLAPENKIPACYEDAAAVVRWCMTHKKELTGNKDSKLGVAGDSAGGNIAAVIGLTIPGLNYQVLIYPSLTLLDPERFSSYKKYGEGHLFTKDLMTWFTQHFLNSDRIAEDAAIGSPLLQNSATKLRQLPPTLFLVAECDPVADHSVEYEAKLRDHGIRTETHILRGAVHGFIDKPGHFKKTMAETLDAVNKFLSSV